MARLNLPSACLHLAMATALQLPVSGLQRQGGTGRVMAWLGAAELMPEQEDHRAHTEAVGPARIPARQVGTHRHVRHRRLVQVVLWGYHVIGSFPPVTNHNQNFKLQTTFLLQNCATHCQEAISHT